MQQLCYCEQRTNEGTVASFISMKGLANQVTLIGGFLRGTQVASSESDNHWHRHPSFVLSVLACHHLFQVALSDMFTSDGSTRSYPPFTFFQRFDLSQCETFMLAFSMNAARRRRYHSWPTGQGDAGHRRVEPDYIESWGQQWALCASFSSDYSRSMKAPHVCSFQFGTPPSQLQLDHLLFRPHQPPVLPPHPLFAHGFSQPPEDYAEQRFEWQSGCGNATPSKRT
ncbi:hypothetical protein BXZ70DRAFT_633795 [Cristinia sonorae]|uniref:Uncharacterized protein n=1 Tax=Cristinia sonorae TaxID=1940300 RepID=A0A8K0XKE9_9AGAR|nr:hypothetical protein BXZ70DRAFT_633795 [Cristinia sonorae]